MAESNASQSEIQRIETINKENSAQFNQLKSIFRTAEFDKERTATMSPSLHPYADKKNYDITSIDVYQAPNTAEIDVSESTEQGSNLGHLDNIGSIGSQEVPMHQTYPFAQKVL